MISTPRANTVEICEVQCFIEVTCESKNFVLTEGGDHVCELNDSDGVRDPDDLVAQRDFFHRAIEVSWRGTVVKNITWKCFFIETDFLIFETKNAR